MANLSLVKDKLEDGWPDSDSLMIGIDTCATSCMTNDINDYVDEPKTSDSHTSALGGKTQANLKGTVKWRWHDDDGDFHTEIIPDMKIVHHFLPGF